MPLFEASVLRYTHEVISFRAAALPLAKVTAPCCLLGLLEYRDHATVLNHLLLDWHGPLHDGEARVLLA